MSIPTTPSAGEALRSVHVKSLHERTVAVVATFFLAAAFVLAGAPAAPAATAATAVQASANSDFSCGSTSSVGYNSFGCECPPGTRLISCFGGYPICATLR